MIWLFAIPAAYQILAIYACLRHALKPRPAKATAAVGVSILKPVNGLQPGFAEAIGSHTGQSYPNFELLIGHHDPNDPAVPVIERAGIRHFVCPTIKQNRKAAVLMDLVEHASNEVIVVNDADIVVPAGYIAEVIGPLLDPGVGLVTCLYRAEGEGWPARFEALGVATDFAASALVAPLTGVSEFGFGSTLAFRREDLGAIGGFAAVADYLADDYQLGARIHQLGRRNVISRVIVQTRLHDETWRAVWNHQIRWARTIRLSRLDGYLGLPLTFATFWSLFAFSSGHWQIGLALMATRLAMAIASGWIVLKSRDSLTLLWLVPLRDLFAAAVWAAALFGDTVEWGGRRLRLDPQGRILPGS